MINIDKFSLISQIYIADEQKNEIVDAITGILDYTDKINNSYHAVQLDSSDNQQQKNIFRDHAISINFDKRILYTNAPDMIEQYFHVPSMIQKR
jgi:Asp-tRNA(Asn)/Glu-tRNA(Gln) amidotransferase C subunit